MSTYMPAAQLNAMVAAAFPPATVRHIGLCNGSPGTTGANEVSGGSYGRKATDWTSASLGKTHNATAMTFTGMPSTTVDHWLTNSTVTAGTYKGGGALTSSLTVPLGSTVSFAIGAITIAATG